jgi:hypothetical protein
MVTQIKPAAKHLYEEDFFVWSQKQASLLREPIRTQRSELLNDLTPSLRRHLADSLSDVCERARHDAEGSLRDHGEHAAADPAGDLPLHARSDHRRLVAVGQLGVR